MIRNLICSVVFVAIGAGAVRSQSLELPEAPFRALREMPVEEPVKGGLEVFVQDEAGQPVADAVVVLMGSSDERYAEARTLAERMFPGDEVLIVAARATLGTRYRVDDRGRTRVPKDQRGRVVALGQAAAGEDRLASVIRNQVGPAGGARVALKLAPAWSFTVQVQNASGEPAASVPLALLESAGAFPFPHAWTDAGGQATFRVFAGRRTETALVRAMIVSRRPVTAPMPDAGVRLEMTLPPCGRVVGNLALPPLPGQELSWTVAVKEAANGTAPAALDSEQPSSGVFGYVEAGLQGMVSCEGGGNGSQSVPFGPIEADEEIRVQLGTSDQTSLVMRILEPSGEPLRSERISVSWRSDLFSSSNSARTNKQGWLALPVPERAQGGGSLVIEAKRGGYFGELFGSQTIEIEKLQDGRNEHGDVALQTPALAVAGRVESADGEPVAEVRIKARGGTRGRHYYAKTDASGRFTLRMPGPLADEVDVELDSQSWFFAREPGSALSVAVGSQGVQLQAQAAARVLFRAEGLPNYALSDFEMFCEGSDGQSVAIGNWMGVDHLNLPAGTWDVVFRFGEQEVHRFEDLVAEPGIEVHDRRFMFFDWRAFARVVSIEVQDEAGKPFDDCTVWLHYANGATGTSPDDGVQKCLVPAEGCRISVEIDEGNVDMSLGVVTTDQIVRLGSGPRLRLQVPVKELPEFPDGVRLQLGAGGQWRDLDAGGRAEIWLKESGALRPKLAVVRGEQRVEVDFVLSEIDVGRGGLDHSIELSEPLRERLRAVLRALD